MVNLVHYSPFQNRVDYLTKMWLVATTCDFLPKPIDLLYTHMAIMSYKLLVHSVSC